MEFVSFVKLLRRRRILLAIGALLALATGALTSGAIPLGGGGSGPSAGEGLAQVLVDTRVPLTATTAPGASLTIVRQALLLADQMSSSAVAATIARDAGIPPRALTVLAPVLAPLTEFSLVPDGQLPQVAAKDTQYAHTPNVVRLVPNYDVPFLTIQTAAPNEHAAVALAQATVSAMQRAILLTGNGAGSANASPPPALHVQQLGPAVGAAVPSAGGRLRVGLVVTIVVFAVWCAVVVVVAGAARGWRRLGGALSRAAL